MSAMGSMAAECVDSQPGAAGAAVQGGRGAKWQGCRVQGGTVILGSCRLKAGSCKPLSDTPNQDLLHAFAFLHHHPDVVVVGQGVNVG
jgi:hypothetical protein